MKARRSRECKQRFLLLVALVSFILIMLFCLVLRTSEQSMMYQGKPEAYWMRVIGRGAGSPELSQMGTNYMSLCLKAVAKRNDPVQTLYLRIWPIIPVPLKARLPLPMNIQQVRTNAAILLATTGDPKALIPLLDSFDPIVRNCAASGLAGVTGANVTSALAKALADADGTVRRSAAFGLGLTDRKRGPVVPALIRALDDQDPQVRILSATCLGMFQANFEAPPVAAVPGLVKRLEDNDPKVRAAAAEALRMIDPNSAVLRLGEVK